MKSRIQREGKYAGKWKSRHRRSKWVCVSDRVCPEATERDYGKPMRRKELKLHSIRDRNAGWIWDDEPF